MTVSPNAKPMTRDALVDDRCQRARNGSQPGVAAKHHVAAGGGRHLRQLLERDLGQVDDDGVRHVLQLVRRRNLAGQLWAGQDRTGIGFSRSKHMFRADVTTGLPRAVYMYR